MRELNEQVMDYRKSENEIVFKLIYETTVGRALESVSSKNRYLANEHEVKQYYEDTLLDLINKYDESKGNFINLFNNSIYKSKKKIIRNTSRREQRFKLTLDQPNSDENAATFEIADEYNLEEHFIKKKEADQQQLIDFLTDPSRVNDPITTAIVSRFDEFDSITALGKALGIHHETIKRKLRKLAKHYDESKFGDHRDYLAV